MTPKRSNRKCQKAIEKIAKDILDLETLATRKWDRLDFQEQAVWSIKEALEAAYEAGRQEGQAK